MLILKLTRLKLVCEFAPSYARNPVAQLQLQK